MFELADPLRPQGELPREAKRVVSPTEAVELQCSSSENPISCQPAWWRGRVPLGNAQRLYLTEEWPNPMGSGPGGIAYRAGAATCTTSVGAATAVAGSSQRRAVMAPAAATTADMTHTAS